MATAQETQEQRILLRNASWGTYERLLEEREGRTPRLTYDRGVLEIMSPLTLRHEEPGENIRLLIRAVAEERGVDLRAAGSMTLKREDIEAGVEPDSSFYIGSEPLVRGKEEVDLSTDPPPDLVIEVDITNSSLDKLPVYARFGVPEVWRYAGGKLEIRVLVGGRYAESAESLVLPGVRADELTRLLEESGRMGSVEWAVSGGRWAVSGER